MKVNNEVQKFLSKYNFSSTLVAELYNPNIQQLPLKDIQNDTDRLKIQSFFRGNSLTEEDFMFVAQQKGVDMRIGIDISSLAFKKQVDQIILIAGDSDFVPAAKLARREGIDFILDPMWADIKEDLFEHSDGRRSQWKKKDES